MQPSSVMPLSVPPAAALTAEEFSSLMNGLPASACPPPGEALAVAVSGGPDSMALAFLLARWGQGRGNAIHAFTVDHGLRPEAAAEARAVCARLSGWPGMAGAVVLTRRPAPEALAARLMERARADRYALLAEEAARRGIAAVAAAHHRDDQAETFLLRLAGGSGLDGLAAMKPAREMRPGLVLLRPLLCVPKARLVATCEANGIEYTCDPSNENLAFARPRLRSMNKALSGEGLTPDRLAATASRIARAREALEVFTGRAFDTSLKFQETDRIVFSFSALVAEPEDIRLRVLRRALALVAPPEADGYGPRLERVEALAARLFAPGGCAGATLGGAVCRSRPGRDELSVARERK